MHEFLYTFRTATLNTEHVSTYIFIESLSQAQYDSTVLAAFYNMHI